MRQLISFLFKAIAMVAFFDLANNSAHFDYIVNYALEQGSPAIIVLSAVGQTLAMFASIASLMSLIEAGNPLKVIQA